MAKRMPSSLSKKVILVMFTARYFNVRCQEASFHTVRYAQHTGTVRRCPSAAKLRVSQPDTMCLCSHWPGDTDDSQRCVHAFSCSAQHSTDAFLTYVFQFIIWKVNILFCCHTVQNFWLATFKVWKKGGGGLKLVTDVTNWQQSYPVHKY